MMDRDTQRSKGFGFVEMINPADAEKAIPIFHEQELDGRRLTVNLAKPREDNSRSDRARVRY
jgi:cold-inducible RNA-binding protein